MNDLNAIEAAVKSHAEATTKALAEQDLSIRALRERQADLEQKTIEAGGGRPAYSADGAITLANELIRNEQVQGVARKASTRTSIEVKASQLLGLETKNTVTGGTFFNSEAGGIFPGLARRRFLRDYLTVVPVSQGSVSWSRETGYTNAAAVQAAEGDEKAESALTFELIDSVIPTVAHFVKASNQALADQAMLLNLISNRLRYGLNIKLDDLVINGAVTGWTVLGNHVPFTPIVGESGVDSVNRAIALMETLEASPTLVLLNPGDFRTLQRLASSGSGEYLFGSPAGQNMERMWGVQVLPTNAIAAGKLIVIDAAQQGELYVREEARIDLGYSGDDFLKNLVVIRAETRALNVTVRPSAVVYGDLNG